MASTRRGRRRGGATPATGAALAAKTEFEEIERKAGDAVTRFLEKNAKGQPGLQVIP
jgi:hypothetical protein